MYAIVATTDYYGPSSHEEPLINSRNKLIVFRRRTEAEAEAAKLNAPDPRYGCHVLAHNQASATHYAVRRVRPTKGGMWRGAWLP